MLLVRPDMRRVTRHAEKTILATVLDQVLLRVREH